MYLFKNSKLYIKCQNNALYGSRIVNHGLLQGPVLSPLFFTVYTYALHGILDKKVKCMDDFCT